MNVKISIIIIFIFYWKGYIDQNGKLEITNLEVKYNLQYEKLKDFIENQTYDVNFLPTEFDKFFFTGFDYKFR